MQDRALNRLYWGVLAGATLLMLALLAQAGRWPFTADGQVVITDFATVWAAAVRTLTGAPALVYDHALHEAYYAALIERPPASGLTFGYPPTAFLVFAPVGLLPYGPALGFYLAIGIALWFAVLRAIVRDTPTALAMALAFGGASQTLLLGQNGFLTAAALAGGLVLLPRRPVLAGVLFGVLAVKPHLGLALALFLLVRRDWHAIGAALATLAAMVLATVLLWGPGLWADYFVASREIAEIVAGRTDTIIGRKMQSVVALTIGALPLGQALAVHAVFALIALGLMLAVLMRRPVYAVQAAAVIAASVLVTPYSFLYDCTMLTAAAAFLLTSALERPERLVLLASMALPGLWFFTATPLVPLVGMAILVLCLRQAQRQGSATPPPAPLQPA